MCVRVNVCVCALLCVYAREYVCMRDNVCVCALMCVCVRVNVCVCVIVSDCSSTVPSVSWQCGKD